mgnify:CR=1 FL=1
MSSQYAVVTGAGTGIGQAVSLGLLNHGWSVALLGRNPESLHETRSLAGENRHQAMILSCDITNPDEVKKTFDRIQSEWNRLDLLFNNAGTNTKGLLEDISYEAWRSVIDTNLTGSFLCTQQAFKIMKAQSPQGGRIINNGSVSSEVPRPNSAPYTSSKHAMTGLTRSTSLDGRKYNIACGQIDIGNVDTTMAQSMKTGMPQANGAISIEDTFDVKHVVDAVLYMSSLPLNANVQFMTVMATKMPFIGRG